MINKEEEKRVDRCIGVLGGTGPAATSYFHQLLVRESQDRYQAEADQDYPMIVVFNRHLGKTTTQGWGEENTDEVGRELSMTAKRLVASGADMIVPVCNTVDLFTAMLRQATALPVLSLPELASERAKQLGLRRVGVLSSQLTRDRGIYSEALAQTGVESVLTNAEEQKVVNELIREVMGHPVSSVACERLRDLSQRLRARQAEAVILGCTELSMLASGEDGMIDSLALAGSEALRFAYGDWEDSSCV